jgi:hypothetical protein
LRASLLLAYNIVDVSGVPGATVVDSEVPIPGVPVDFEVVSVTGVPVDGIFVLAVAKSMQTKFRLVTLS